MLDPPVAELVDIPLDELSPSGNLKPSP
jgi:hypothetical protein